jgi:hypothetical protein
VRFSYQEALSLVTSDQDAFVLLGYLRAVNGPNATFMVANGLADKHGWSRKRLAAARKRLEGNQIIMVRPASHANGPAMYRWPSGSRRGRRKKEGEGK